MPLLWCANIQVETQLFLLQLIALDVGCVPQITFAAFLSWQDNKAAGAMVQLFPIQASNLFTAQLARCQEKHMWHAVVHFGLSCDAYWQTLPDQSRASPCLNLQVIVKVGLFVTILVGSGIQSVLRA